MLEKQVEAYLVDRVKELGGIAYKFVSPARRSVPDRLVLLPGGRAVFVELKRPGLKATPAQQREQLRIHTLGFLVLTLDTKEGVDRYFPKPRAHPDQQPRPPSPPVH
jgi:hypothetical protein